MHSCLTLSSLSVWKKKDRKKERKEGRKKERGERKKEGRKVEKEKRKVEKEKRQEIFKKRKSQKPSAHSLRGLRLKSNSFTKVPFLQTSHIVLDGPFSPSVSMPPPALFGGTEANHRNISSARSRNLYTYR